MTIRPVHTLLCALRRARLKRQRERLGRERVRLAELRESSAEVIAAQVRRIAELEGRFLASLPSAPANSRTVARMVEQRAKLAILG